MGYEKGVLVRVYPNTLSYLVYFMQKEIMKLRNVHTQVLFGYTP